MNKEQLQDWLSDEIEDIVTDFFYYDRKSDETVNNATLDKLLSDGQLTKPMIIDEFVKHINNTCENL